METMHRLVFGDSRSLYSVESESVALIVTSPPYPMIELWDEVFGRQDRRISEALDRKEGYLAFELMNQVLDRVWDEVYRVLMPGGIACINIGDATRKVDDDFNLYPNHSRIQSYCLKKGFQVLPEILWRKQTNAPNKFMGSGMLPSGAYVTLEHEFILILRKGGRRVFTPQEQRARMESAYFWEERNVWFSDVWDFKGAGQKLNGSESRGRSGAYPFELAYRLINMYSIQGDTVLDPFLGTATTTLAAMASGRNSVGVEIDPSFRSYIEKRITGSVPLLRKYGEDRLKKHQEFVGRREEERKDLKYVNEYYGFPVMTLQEVNLKSPVVKGVSKRDDDVYVVSYTYYRPLGLQSYSS